MTWATIEPTPLALSPEHHAAVNDLLDACVDWQAGRLNFVDVMKMGGFRSPMYTRRAAIQTTPLDDPRRPALMQLFDMIDRMQGMVHTNFGTFHRYEIAEHDRLFDRASLERERR